MEVPSSLKSLLRMVLRGFYEVEHMLVIDILIRKIYMTEEDIEELIKFEKKQLRNVIQQLRNEKILKARIKMETGPDKKSKKQNYYYINYRGFVNVVKYKLDHIRRKIETEERDNTTRASFICTQCKKTYTDLEADQLCDLTTGEFRCNYCGDIVEEESSALPKADSRLVLAKFNQQIEPLYLLLKEVEDLKLPAELLEPEPIEAVLPVKIEETSESITVCKKKDLPNGSNDAQPKKERPAWLTESTIYDENENSSMNVNKTDSLNGITTIKTENDNSILNYFQSNGINLENDQAKENKSKEILEALLIHEKSEENSFKSTNGLTNSSSSINHFGNDYSIKMNGNYHQSKSNQLNGHLNNSNNLINNDESSNDTYELFRIPMAHVNGKSIPLTKVNDDTFKLMNQQEREEYVRLSSEYYHLIYD